ncbi:uncharacterized protein [Eurosta solidaginis]|uniref:uncharacterized protein n=1 Tax=Eurosta solidaginis TaxID=178769 RepID=UPI003530F498
MMRFTEIRKRADATEFPLICRICQKKHPLQVCPVFRSLSTAERWIKVNRTRHCVNSLSPLHRAGHCIHNGRCQKCGDDHHTMLNLQDAPKSTPRPTRPILWEADDSDTTCDTASVNSDIVDFMQQWRQRNIGIESPSRSQPFSSSSHDFNLQQVLNAHPTVDYYHKDPITLRPAGRLYDKYYNTLKRLKKSGELVDPESPTPETSPTEEHTFTFGDEKSAYDWLNLFDSPWSTVEAYWKKTFKTRRQQILNSSGNTLANILRNWKLFSHSCGYNLIDIDFTALHQNSSRLRENWQGFKTKVLPILNKRVKDTQNLQHLKKVNETEQGSDQLIALLLHAVLRPNIKRKSDNKTVFRSTIKDSQLSFLLRVNTVNDVGNKLDNLKTSLYARGETLQPLIIAIGSDLSDCKFYVYYDDIKYELPSFLSALDICFKTFHVLHLKYPQDSIEFWTFVQRYFYSIELTEDKPSPNVLCLLIDLM